MGKFTRWTEDAIVKVAKECNNVRHFHDKFRGAEKAAIKLGIMDRLFPNKQIHRKAYTKEEITYESKKYATRSALQKENPSLYNAARKLNIINSIFPIQLNRKKEIKELMDAASKFKSRRQFELEDPKNYQVVQKRGLLNEIGIPKLQGTSTAEIELLVFLQTLVLDFKTKRFGNDYEIDCYSESLKLGVEYNGLYWHSEEGGKDRQYHIKKTKYFEKLGIRLIHIWEHEWRDRQEQVKNYLMSACRANSTKIGARKCEFKEITADLARYFLAATHIQGKPVSVVYAIGCYFNNILIAVATFGKHHRDSNINGVLNRFACLPGHTVSGGLAKISNMAFNKLGPLLSWADYCKSQGKGYEAAGWVKQRTLEPDYFYVDKRGYAISKQARKKSNVGTSENMTEYEHAIKDGLHRIWDCGKIVLVYSK